MKIHTTNYQDTFIKIAEDCPAATGQIPPTKGDIKTIATLQFEIIHKYPYEFTSDDVLFDVFTRRNELIENELKEARKQFFSKGQACLRASPLTKRYGWGIHFNNEGKIAIYPANSPEYQKFVADPALKIVQAMKSRK